MSRNGRRLETIRFSNGDSPRIEDGDDDEPVGRCRPSDIPGHTESRGSNSVSACDSAYTRTRTHKGIGSRGRNADEGPRRQGIAGGKRENGRKERHSARCAAHFN